MRVIYALLGAALMSACAGMTVEPVNDEEEDRNARGIRSYEMAPFLLIYSNGKGGLTSQVLFLPDTTRKISIDPFAVLAKNNSTLKFTNGVLTNAKTSVDETIVPKSMIEAFGKAAASAIDAAFSLPGEGAVASSIPAPYLFKIVVDARGSRLVGGPGVGPDGKPVVINVTVSEPMKPSDKK